MDVLLYIPFAVCHPVVFYFPPFVEQVGPDILYVLAAVSSGADNPFVAQIWTKSARMCSPIPTRIDPVSPTDPFRRLRFQVAGLVQAKQC